MVASLSEKQAMFLMQCVITIAWADDSLDRTEMELISEYLEQFEFCVENQLQIYRWILEAPELSSLAHLADTYQGKLAIIGQAYVMAYADKRLHIEELKIIDFLVKQWQLAENDVAHIRAMIEQFYDLVPENRDCATAVFEIIAQMKPAC